MAGAFAGKTIVVTGSGKHKGLGQGILQAFADEGANCVVSDLAIDAEALAVAEDLRARGAAVATIACDVSIRRWSVSAASTSSSTMPGSASR